MIPRISLTQPEGRYDEYKLLKFYRPGEMVTRIDRYSVIMYWDTYDSEGNTIRISNLFFYPSKFAIEEIDLYSRMNTDSVLYDGNKIGVLVHRLHQLRYFGNPWWKKDTDVLLTPETWTLKDPPVPVITKRKLKMKSPQESMLKKHPLTCKKKRLMLRGKHD